MTKLVFLLAAMLFSMTGCSNAATEAGQSSLPPVLSPPISATGTASTSANISKEQNNMEDSITLTLKATYKGFQAPTGIAVDNDGNLYVSNWSGSTVTKVDKDGNHSVFADGMGSPAGLAFDKTGSLYISDYSKDVIYRVTPDGKKSTFAQGFHTPTGIAFNQSGELLVTNRGSNEIVKVGTSGKVEPAADGMRTPVGVVEDLDGILYVTNYGGGIIKVAADGTTSTVSDEFGRPGVGIDIVAVLVHADTLYVGSWNDGAVYAYSIEVK